MKVTRSLFGGRSELVGCDRPEAEAIAVLADAVGSFGKIVVTVEDSDGRVTTYRGEDENALGLALEGKQ